LRPTSDERFWPRLRPLRQQWSSGWQTPYRTVASPPAQPCGQDGERCPVGTCRIGARSRSNNSKWDSNTNLNRPRLSSPGGRGGASTSRWEYTLHTHGGREKRTAAAAARRGSRQIEPPKCACTDRAVPSHPRFAATFPLSPHSVHTMQSTDIIGAQRLVVSGSNNIGEVNIIPETRNGLPTSGGRSAFRRAANRGGQSRKAVQNPVLSVHNEKGKGGFHQLSST